MGPGYNPLRDRLLQDARQRVDADLGPYWQEAEYTGITLMSDGWTDPCHRPLINVLAATPKGSCFLFAENCEGHFKDATFTAACVEQGHGACWIRECLLHACGWCIRQRCSWCPLHGGVSQQPICVCQPVDTT